MVMALQQKSTGDASQEKSALKQSITLMSHMAIVKTTVMALKHASCVTTLRKILNQKSHGVYVSHHQVSSIIHARPKQQYFNDQASSLWLSFDACVCQAS